MQLRHSPFTSVFLAWKTKSNYDFNKQNADLLLYTDLSLWFRQELLSAAVTKNITSSHSLGSFIKGLCPSPILYSFILSLPLTVCTPLPLSLSLFPLSPFLLLLSLQTSLPHPFPFTFYESFPPSRNKILKPVTQSLSLECGFSKITTPASPSTLTVWLYILACFLHHFWW